MKKLKKKKWLQGVVVVLVVVGVSLALLIHKIAPNNVLIGTVTNLEVRPNRVEDGSYRIKLKTDGGSDITINATGLMNSLADPDQLKIECVSVPELKVGDRIKFNLPRSKKSETYDICFDQGTMGYYIELI